MRPSIISVSCGISSLRSRKGGDDQFNNIDPVEQVLAEITAINECRQVFVGRAGDPDIDRDLSLGANRPDTLLLDRAQQLDLHVERQVGHFIEKQGAAVRRLEQPLFVADGAGNTPLHVAEEFTLHQLLGDSAAVNGDEVVIGAGALLVDLSRGKFLAGARFTADEDRGLASRQFMDHAADLLGGGELPQ
jgi:hypothetical protein